jgi:NAD(P)-dependent dehydrogenase (short-subunit alcohol dehydrogenase family)
MLALEGGPDGVRSNVLCPEDTWPGMRHMSSAGKEDRPEGRDVAAAAVFYASVEPRVVRDEDPPGQQPTGGPGEVVCL